MEVEEEETIEIEAAGGSKSSKTATAAALKKLKTKLDADHAIELEQLRTQLAAKVCVRVLCACVSECMGQAWGRRGAGVA